MKDKPIFVTEPYLPPLEEYVEYLKGIWDRKYLTNQGPLVQELESKLQDYHRLTNKVHCVANGGLGLQIILKAMGVKGEVITTPFSYVATASCPLWEGCRVKFADIEPDYLTLDPLAVESSITSETEAILATHVFGNPCNVEAFDRIGEKYGIPIIYDAAHAFGVTFKGKSLLEWGDASMVSMHATKLFHTVEGGFVVAKDPVVSEKIEWMRKFGHKGQEEFHGVGINAKMSEFHAAMGLCQIENLSRLLRSRSTICELYFKRVSTMDSVDFAFDLRSKCLWNSCYFPVLFKTAKDRESSSKRLLDNNIQCRRYFYPILSEMVLSVQNRFPVATSVSDRILCLPVHHGLSLDQVKIVCDLLEEN